jgi:hypothetical protein
MATSRAFSTPDPISRADATVEQCLAFYNANLKAKLEPKHSGQYVAIHADTHEYVISRSSGEAMREMHKLHPKGQVLIHRIGLTPADSGLAARMLGARVAARPQ